MLKNFVNGIKKFKNKAKNPIKIKPNRASSSKRLEWLLSIRVFLRRNPLTDKNNAKNDIWKNTNEYSNIIILSIIH